MGGHDDLDFLECMKCGADFHCEEPGALFSEDGSGGWCPKCSAEHDRSAIEAMAAGLGQHLSREVGDGAMEAAAKAALRALREAEWRVSPPEYQDEKRASAA